MHLKTVLTLGTALSLVVAITATTSLPAPLDDAASDVEPRWECHNWPLGKHCSAGDAGHRTDTSARSFFPTKVFCPAGQCCQPGQGGECAKTDPGVDARATPPPLNPEDYNKTAIIMVASTSTPPPLNPEDYNKIAIKTSATGSSETKMTRKPRPAPIRNEEPLGMAGPYPITHTTLNDATASSRQAALKTQHLPSKTIASTLITKTSPDVSI